MNKINKSELAYWIALAHIEGMPTTTKMEVVVSCFNNNKQLSDFFTAENKDKTKIYSLPEKYIDTINQSNKSITNSAFMAENLLEQGYDIITVLDEFYPKNLKKNLKYNAPLILYTKGNKELLKKPATAIVGSRKSGDKAIEFTDRIAKKEVAKGNVIVSGYAKGVDLQALNSAVIANGESIIVLPQGITTFTSGYKQVYRQIINGQVLILSTFHPNAGWSTGLAMARNSTIYALANNIFVAESDNKGGTWSGVLSGIDRQRKNKEDISIFVRIEDGEQNANRDLVLAGAKAVDGQGNLLKTENVIEDLNDITKKIRQILSNRELRPIEIIKQLDINWKEDKMKRFLDSLSSKGVIKRRKGKYNVYTIENNPPSLF